MNFGKDRYILRISQQKNISMNFVKCFVISQNRFSFTALINKPKKLPMKLTLAIKKAEKVTGAKAIVNGQFYSFIFGEEVLSFAVNGRLDENSTITCIKTRRNWDMDDSMTDYSAGCFHDNLTQALKFIKAI